MKNFNLLLATTAILSTTLVMNANSTDTVSSTLDSQVILLQPTTIQGYGTTSRLDFGAIRMRAGDVLKINPDSTIDNSVSTAEHIATSGKDYGDAGHFTVSGGIVSFLYNQASDHVVEDDPTITEQQQEELAAVGINGLETLYDVWATAKLGIVIPDIELKSGTFTCGNVSDFTTMSKFEGLNHDTLDVRIGGTLTLTDSFEDVDEDTLLCTGSATVTVMSSTAFLSN